MVLAQAQPTRRQNVNASLEFGLAPSNASIYSGGAIKRSHYSLSRTTHTIVLPFGTDISAYISQDESSLRSLPPRRPRFDLARDAHPRHGTRPVASLEGRLRLDYDVRVATRFPTYMYVVTLMLPVALHLVLLL